MADTKPLGDMLDDIINKKGDQAEVHFHDFAQAKLKELLYGDDTSTTDETNKDERNEK